MEYEEHTDYWEDFRICSKLRLDEAAALLAGDNPHDAGDVYCRSDRARLILRELKYDFLMDWGLGVDADLFKVGSGKRIPFEEFIYLSPEKVADYSTAPIDALAEWADSKGIPHHWPRKQSGNATTTDKPAPVIPYTEELQAAIDAYEAVRGNPEATRGCSPKQALLAWLEENRPTLGAKARERIATVCNWNPQGGAPATPTGRDSE